MNITQDPPFKNLNNLFNSNQSAARKVLGGASAGLLIGLYLMVEGLMRGEADAREIITMGVGVGLMAGTFGAAGAAVLVFMDVVARRVQSGQRVHPILLAYFGQRRRGVMFLLWFLTILGVSFVGIVGYMIITVP